MTFTDVPAQKEISEFSCRNAPPAWFPVIVLGPVSAPTCALAPPRSSIPYPGFEPGPDVLFVMLVWPRVLKLACELQTPGPPLPLISTVRPFHVKIETLEFPPIIIPPLML